MPARTMRELRVQLGENQMSSGNEGGSFHGADVSATAENSNLQSSETNTASTPSLGVNVVCYTSPGSLAECVKQLVCALQAARIPFVVNDVSTGRDMTLSAYLSDDNPYPVNIIHINASEAREFVVSRPSSYFERRINVGIWYWELPTLPTKWVPYFKLYDEIWVTSRFIHEALSKVSSMPIRKIPFPLTIDTPICQLPRERFGLKESMCAFVFTFDYQSVFERKNPLAVVQAFRDAFDRRDEALLIINSIHSHADLENSRRLRDAAREARILILDGRLTRPDYFALLAAADCYVSLHRSEGFGITMAQSMYLGKPVIATGYSGNLEFMNKDNSLPVRFNLVELDKNYGPYEKGNIWAEPDVKQAVDLMRWVYDHRNESRKLGGIASRDVRRQMDPKVVGDEIRSRLREAIGRNLNFLD
jgi:glycosyltransferase involved in cell wall biosynthesis